MSATWTNDASASTRCNVTTCLLKITQNAQVVEAKESGKKIHYLRTVICSTNRESCQTPRFVDLKNSCPPLPLASRLNNVLPGGQSMLCSLVTALSIRAACTGLLLPPVFCRGLAVKFISELSAPNKSSPSGSHLADKARTHMLCGGGVGERAALAGAPGPVEGGLSPPASPNLSHSPWLFSSASDWWPWIGWLF